MRSILSVSVVLFGFLVVYIYALPVAHAIPDDGNRGYSQSSYANSSGSPDDRDERNNYSQSSYSSTGIHSSAGNGDGGSDSSDSSSGGSGYSNYVPQVIKSVANTIWSSVAKPTIDTATKVFEAATAVVTRNTERVTYTSLPSGDYLSSDGRVTQTQEPRYIIKTPTTADIKDADLDPVPASIQAQIDAIAAQQARTGVITSALTPTQKAILERAKIELGADINNPAVESTILLATKGMSVNEALFTLSEVESITGGNINRAAIDIAFGRSCGDADCRAAEQLRDLAGVGGVGGSVKAQAELEKQMQGVDQRKRAEATQKTTTQTSTSREDSLNAGSGSGSTQGDTAKQIEEAKVAAEEAGRKAADRVAGSAVKNGYGDTLGQQLGTTYSGPKGTPTALSIEARQANVRQLGYDVPKVTATEKEVELMTRMILAETRSIRSSDGTLNLEGAQAVAEVIRNRVLSPSFPNNLTDVILQPNQFSPTNTGAQWSKQYAPGSSDYNEAEKIARGVLNGEIAPIAVTQTGSAMVNYQNNDTVFNKPGYSSNSTKTSVTSVIERGLTLTIVDATRDWMQHTFGNRGNPEVPDFTPNDTIAVSTRTFETTQPSVINQARTTPLGKTVEKVVRVVTNPVGFVVGLFNNTLGGPSTNNYSPSNDNDTPTKPTTPTTETPAPSTDLYSTATGATETGKETATSTEYKFGGSITRVIYEAEEGLKTTDINANYADTVTTSLSVDYQCDNTVDATSVTTNLYTAFDVTQDTSKVLLSLYVPVTEFGTHCFFITTDTQNVVKEKDESNNKSNVYRFIVGEGV